MCGVASYRVIDDRGQVIDVLVSKRRDAVAVRGFFTAALRDHGQPGEVVTERAAALAKAIGETGTGRVTQPGAVRQQSGRSRSRQVESAAATDARLET